jgi:outer membrane protein TolC
MAQASYGQSVLEDYIQSGLSQNQSIKQQEFALDKSMYALKEAKALFLPNVSFMADYFLAGGGRTVDFPAGDLLNPVYSSLNLLTNSNNFPQLENQTILLNPHNFYDAKFRTTLPLFNPEIIVNRRIKEDLVSLQQLEVDLYKRDLVREIKSAYFNYLKSIEAVKIYESALRLTNENKRINRALFDNDKVNRTVVLRTENEITKFEALEENARQNSHSARAYFNFLLNKNLNDSIITDTLYRAPAFVMENSLEVSGKEELRKLRIASDINQHTIDLTKSHHIPKLSSFLDLGSQGFDGNFDSSTRYYFLGISLQWDIFASGKNEYKTRQAQLEGQIIDSQTAYARSQLELQLVTAVNKFEASVFSYESAVSSFNTLQKNYADFLRLYKEGQALYIELLDAQNQLVQAELEMNISLYDTYIKAADIERAGSSLQLN